MLSFISFPSGASCSKLTMSLVKDVHNAKDSHILSTKNNSVFANVVASGAA